MTNQGSNVVTCPEDEWEAWKAKTREGAENGFVPVWPLVPAGEPCPDIDPETLVREPVEDLIHRVENLRALEAHRD